MATVSLVLHISLVPTVRNLTERLPPPLFAPMKVLLLHQRFLSRYWTQLPTKKPFYLAIYPSGKQLNWKSRKYSCLRHFKFWVIYRLYFTNVGDNEQLKDLHSAPNIVQVIKSRRMRRAGHVAGMGERRGVYRVLVGKSEGMGPLGRPRRRWKDNIKTDLQKVGCGGCGLDRAGSG